jgi:single-strand DNA-binding protein
MLNLNRAMLIGNATRDAELRSTPNGRSVASFAVATNRRYQDASGERKDEVQFHEIVAWGKLAEIAGQIVRKGSKVYVEGRLQSRSWEGQDGAKRERTEIIAENIIALSPKGEMGGGGYEAPASSEPEVEKSAPSAPKETKSDDGEINLDDIPF